MPDGVEIRLMETAAAIVHQNGNGLSPETFEDEIPVGVAVDIACNQAISDHRRVHNEGAGVDGTETQVDLLFEAKA